MDGRKKIQRISVAKRLPPVDEVVQAVVGAVKSSMHFDFLTFSGNGEPTLYPHFAEIVGEVVRIRDRYRPEVKIALLSNSSRLVDETIRESVGKIDIPVFKLDAGSEPTFKHINRPAREVNFTKILDTLSSLEDIYIQTMFIQGNPSNVTPEEIMAYFQQLSRIQPKKVHIYSIDRPVPNAEIALVSPKKLEQIAFQGQHETNVPIKPFYLKS